MTKYVLGFLSFTTLGLAFSSPVVAQQGGLMVAATMQRCIANEECALVTQSCSDNCGFVPINKSNLPALQSQYQQRCGKDMNANPTCTMNPPIKAACINSRCTIDYAYTNNADAKDYQPGAYPVPEQPTQSKVQGDYSKVDDRHGFTAYNLPQDQVKEKTVGTITTKVYVPPSAPVSGGNYVPVTPTATQAPTNIPPAAVPRAQTYATPPQAYPAPAVPATPNAMVPASGTAGYEYVPAPTQPTIPAPGLPRAPVAPAATATPAIPSIGATGVPQAPPGSVPIPPSDLKPAPSLVPPPGATVPVNPEDPGASPQPMQEGADLMPIPTPDGGLALTGKQPGTTTAVATSKSFAGIPAKTSKSVNTNE